MTHLRSLLLGLGIVAAVAALQPLTASAADQSVDVVEGRVLLISSVVSSSSLTPAYVLRVVVGDDLVTVTLSADAVLVGSDGQPAPGSHVRANDIVSMRGAWQSADRFTASWLQWSAA